MKRKEIRKLEKLKSLLDQCLITETEYESLKAKILKTAESKPKKKIISFLVVSFLLFVAAVLIIVEVRGDNFLYKFQKIEKIPTRGKPFIGINSEGVQVNFKKTLYDNSFVVESPSHIPVQFSVPEDYQRIKITAISSGEVDYILMNKIEYENRISLLLGGYKYYPSCSGKSINMEREIELSSGDYIFVVQNMKWQPRNVNVTIDAFKY